ncbi:uncharacterized protein PRCAT00000143001 [Priceomyces carsonii]|uniref:uncharacterized protein n=1 Tax=Priceomyces carsonii TaxID=28549 RepID=UPI002EDA894E|nr:unnamed protein product [Priceomyces carsonii]
MLVARTYTAACLIPAAAVAAKYTLRFKSSAIKTHAPQPAPETHRHNPLSISTRILENDESAKHDDRQFITHPMFPHPWFADKDCEKIHFEHRVPETRGDKIAYGGTTLARAAFDFVTGYKKPRNEKEEIEGFKGTRYEMTESKWLTRCIFLESIAGVPGMVAAFIRHLHSLRLLRRDKAWIETLLDEAYNERMHLLTFIKLGDPSWFTRLVIYFGQGIFCNVFFLCYLINPRYCHRFVGYLEEEAVSTYSHLIKELDLGKNPKFKEVEIPTIAVQYWPELKDNSSFRDLILRIRADEAKHREVNHTLANLKQKGDRNPFALKIKNVNEPQPDNGIENTKGKGWDRDELIL